MWVFDQLTRIERKLDKLLTLVDRQGARTMALADDVNDLIAAVDERKTVGDSVMVLLTELNDMLKAQVTDPAAQQALQGAIAALKAKNKEVADAIIANTPAAP